MLSKLSYENLSITIFTDHYAIYYLINTINLPYMSNCYTPSQELSLYLLFKKSYSIHLNYGDPPPFVCNNQDVLVLFGYILHNSILPISIKFRCFFVLTYKMICVIVIGNTISICATHTFIRKHL